MEWEYRFDIRPISMLRSYAGTSVFSGVVDHMVNLSESLCGSEWLLGQSCCSVFDRLHLSYSMQPILHPRSVYNTGEDVLIGNFDEHEEGAIVAISNFCCEANFGEGSDKFLELFCRTGPI